VIGSLRRALIANGAILLAGCGDSGAGLLGRLTRQQTRAPTVAASAVLARAETLYLATRFDSVVALLNPALAASRQRPDPVAETRILTRLGLTADKQGESPAAHRYLDEALRVASKHRLSGDLLEVHNALGLVSRNEERYAEARSHFEEAIRIAQEIRDPLGFAKTSGNLGLALADCSGYATRNVWRSASSFMRVPAANSSGVCLQPCSITTRGRLSLPP